MDSTQKEKNNGIFVISTDPPKKERLQKKSPFHIDTETLRFKLHFFLFIGAMGLTLPFMTIFATTKIGLSGTALGALLTSQQLVFTITKPLMGYIADYFNKLKAMICILMMIFTISMFLLLPIPHVGESDVSIDSYESLKICEFHEINTNLSEIDTYNTRIIEVCENVSNHNLFDSSKYTKLPNGTISLRTLPCYNNISHFSEIGSMLENIKSTDEMNYFCYNENAPYSVDVRSFSSDNWSRILCCKNLNKNDLIVCECFSNATEVTDGENDFYTYQFWVYAVINSIGMTCVNAMFTLSDTACCESVRKTGADFGRQRLYGAVGWGLMSIFGGLLFDYTNSYLPSFILMGLMTLITLWNISKLDMVKPQFSQNILKDVGSVFKSSEFLVFEAGVLMCGLGTSIMWFYHAVFLTSIGASRLLCGLSQGVQCFIGELPFMFYSGWFIEKVGHHNVLSLALMAYAVRFLWYSFLTNPWLVLPVEIFHGFTYGLFYPALAAYAKQNAKPGTEATTQAVIFTTFECIGAGLGCILAGIGYDYLGWQQMFQFASASSACGMVVMLIGTFLLKRYPKTS